MRDEKLPAESRVRRREQRVPGPGQPGAWAVGGPGALEALRGKRGEGGPERCRCHEAQLVAGTPSVHFIPGSCGELACFLIALDGF